MKIKYFKNESTLFFKLTRKRHNLPIGIGVIEVLIRLKNLSAMQLSMTSLRSDLKTVHARTD